MLDFIFSLRACPRQRNRKGEKAKFYVIGLRAGPGVLTILSVVLALLAWPLDALCDPPAGDAGSCRRRGHQRNQPPRQYA